MSALGASAGDQAEHEEPPGYTPIRELQEHVNSIYNRNPRPWVTLWLRSQAPMENERPVYYDGSMVLGSVLVSLETPQTIRSVVVEVRFRMCE
jgi:hypothetical protein